MKSIDQIASQFSTCHDSLVVMACAKLWCDLMIKIKVRIESKFQLWANKESVKQCQVVGVRQPVGQLITATRLLHLPWGAHMRKVRYGIWMAVFPCEGHPAGNTRLLILIVLSITSLLQHLNATALTANIKPLWVTINICLLLSCGGMQYRKWYQCTVATRVVRPPGRDASVSLVKLSRAGNRHRNFWQMKTERMAWYVEILRFYLKSFQISVEMYIKNTVRILGEPYLEGQDYGKLKPQFIPQMRSRLRPIPFVHVSVELSEIFVWSGSVNGFTPLVTDDFYLASWWQHGCFRS